MRLMLVCLAVLALLRSVAVAADAKFYITETVGGQQVHQHELLTKDSGLCLEVAVAECRDPELFLHLATAGEHGLLFDRVEIMADDAKYVLAVDPSELELKTVDLFVLLAVVTTHYTYYDVPSSQHFTLAELEQISAAGEVAVRLVDTGKEIVREFTLSPELMRAWSDTLTYYDYLRNPDAYVEAPFAVVEPPVDGGAAGK